MMKRLIAALCVVTLFVGAPAVGAEVQANPSDSEIVRPKRPDQNARPGQPKRITFRVVGIDQAEATAASVLATPVSCSSGATAGRTRVLEADIRPGRHDLYRARWRVGDDWRGCWRVDVAVGGVAIGSRTYVVRGDAAHADSIDVMSFNLRYDNPDDTWSWSDRRGAVFAMLRERRPDIVGVQEALNHQVRDLADGLAGYEWFGVGRDDGVAAGEYAAIFYRADRFRVLDAGNFWLSETPEVPSYGWDAAAIRIVTWSIDYVFFSSGAALRFETVDDDYGVPFISDHYPIVATLDCRDCA